jgi:WD domain, G-beta repeat
MPGWPAMPPAPDPPSGSRLALVVATGTYADPGLRQLRAPARDADDLAQVLADPGIGGFTVTTVIDQPAQQIRLAIEDFLVGRGTGDLLLVYLSCHGLLDAYRRLYFAATDTRKDRLGATGVEAAWVLDLLERCRARRQVLILDSCFSGAFAHGAKGEADLSLQGRFVGQGRGRVVLTASTATEYSFEGDPTEAVTPAGSVFTAALVEGLRTGAADTDRDGCVYVDDAYAYVFDQVKAAGAAQTPQRWLYEAEGRILLARNPAVPVITPEPLPESLRAGLDRATATRDAPALFRTVRKSQPLSAVAFSPDSRWLALGDSAGFARLEEVTSGTEGLILQHPGPVLGLAFSQDGRWLATIDEDGTARIWDAISGKERLAIPSRGVKFLQMAFAPDGRRLATGGFDGIGRIWDASYGLEQLQVSEFWEEAGRAAHVNDLSFSPDGRWLATAHTNGIAVIWDAHTGQKRRTYQHTDSGVDRVSFGPDGRFLAVGGTNGRTQVVDIETGWVVLAVAHPDEGSQTITSVGLSPDGRWLATSSFDTSARVWDTHDGHEHLKITHEHIVGGVVFSPDGHWLATCSVDQTCQIWQLRSGGPRRAT